MHKIAAFTLTVILITFFCHAASAGNLFTNMASACFRVFATFGAPQTPPPPPLTREQRAEKALIELVLKRAFRKTVVTAEGVRRQKELEAEYSPESYLKSVHEHTGVTERQQYEIADNFPSGMEPSEANVHAQLQIKKITFQRADLVLLGVKRIIEHRMQTRKLELLEEYASRPGLYYWPQLIYLDGRVVDFANEPIHNFTGSPVHIEGARLFSNWFSKVFVQNRPYTIGEVTRFEIDIGFNFSSQGTAFFDNHQTVIADLIPIVEGFTGHPVIR